MTTAAAVDRLMHMHEINLINSQSQCGADVRRKAYSRISILQMPSNKTDAPQWLCPAGENDDLSENHKISLAITI